MKSLHLLALSVLLIAGCGDADSQQPQVATPHSQPGVSETPKYCGGEVKAGLIEAYFKRLSDYLAENNTAVPLDFYDEGFGIISGGRHRLFNRDELGAGAGDLPTLDDWREIARRGPLVLEDAGWRGCLMANGKVWFEGDGETFSLKSFNKDMAWD